MKNWTLVLVLAACVLGTPGLARGQLWSGYGAGGWGGWPGESALASADNLTATGMQLKAQSRQLGQQAAMGQNMVIQSGIRNTLTTQAQSRTDAVLGQGQATQDWFFQNQQQQMAQRRTGGSGPVSAAGGLGLLAAAAGFAPDDSPPEAAMDVIKWPIALQDHAFATWRAQIEAPYRRSPPALSTPTAGDFRAMVKTVEDMKSVLEWQLGQGGLITQDYKQAKTFLDALAKEAQSRS